MFESWTAFKPILSNSSFPSVSNIVFIVLYANPISFASMRCWQRYASITMSLQQNAIIQPFLVWILHPTPKAYMVEEAELDFINGGYEIDQNNPIEGRDGSRAELWFSYLRKVPESVPMPHQMMQRTRLWHFLRCRRYYNKNGGSSARLTKWAQLMVIQLFISMKLLIKSQVSWIFIVVAHLSGSQYRMAGLYQPIRFITKRTRL